ncbi:MAG: APC family permease [Elusimicrobiota bacterium]
MILTTAMLTFISFWRAAAIVLCDLASTAWYVGGIAEQAIGKAAPWFILAVMAFSACVLALYIEGSAMFVRGGVYKVVKEAMGGTLAKMSVSALMFDYVLTGAISSVSAGQYLAGLINSAFPYLHIDWHVEPKLFSCVFAIAAVLYFWRQNILGIEESSDKALKIIWATAVMGVVMIGFCVYTAAVRGFSWPPLSLSFTSESLGWLQGSQWPQRIGALGVLIALGHAFLGMSGVETLAQVYREMEAPKLRNLKRAAWVIFLFAFLLTVSISFFAVGLMPDAVRGRYLDNLIAGLAMSVAAPHWLQLMLQAFVVTVGAAILCGAVNTAIVGSNGVMNRLAEDGVMPDWFRYLHPKFGTTHRMINLVVGLQVVTILLCRGDVYLLGEAYAFGLIWSLAFNAASVVMLRFQVRTPREWMVPGNIKFGNVQFPVGLSSIFLVLFSAAVINLFTKRIATIYGLTFAACFFTLLAVAERLNAGKRAQGPEHREKLNLRNEESLAQVLSEIDRPHRILVAVRDPHGMQHVHKTLEKMDSETTDMIVLYCKIQHGLSFGGDIHSLGPEEELVFTRVIAAAEKCGKSVTPLLVVSNDPFYAIAQSAQAVGAEDVVLGVSGRVNIDHQIERLAMTWGALQGANTKPVNIHVIGEGREYSVEI